MTTDDEYRLLGFTDADREAAEKFEADPVVVAELASEIRREIGAFRGEGSGPTMPEDSRNSIAAFLETLPDIRRYHAERGISDEVSWATLADLGQQLDDGRVRRRTDRRRTAPCHSRTHVGWQGLRTSLRFLSGAGRPRRC